MIYNFNTYNESLRDKMKPKDLPDDVKDILNKFDQFYEIDDRFTNLSMKNNIYNSINFYFNIEIEYSADNNKWIIFKSYKGTVYNDIDEIALETDDFNLVLKYVVNKCFYNSIDSYINDTKEEIKDKETYLNKLEKFKKFAEYDL